MTPSFQPPAKKKSLKLEPSSLLKVWHPIDSSWGFHWSLGIGGSFLERWRTKGHPNDPRGWSVVTLGEDASHVAIQRPTHADDPQWKPEKEIVVRERNSVALKRKCV